MKKPKYLTSFERVHRNLRDLLMDHELASLGDAYVNFVYSLTLSNRNRAPRGAKVKGALLAEAVRRAGLRPHLPSGMNTHALADAAEALIVHAWLNGCITMEQALKTLREAENDVEGFAVLMKKIANRIRFS